MKLVVGNNNLNQIPDKVIPRKNSESKNVSNLEIVMKRLTNQLEHFAMSNSVGYQHTISNLQNENKIMKQKLEQFNKQTKQLEQAIYTNLER